MKKKMYMRFLAIVLSFVMVMSMLPADVIAAEEDASTQDDMIQTEVESADETSEKGQEQDDIALEENSIKTEQDSMNSEEDAVENQEENTIDFVEDSSNTDATDIEMESTENEAMDAETEVNIDTEEDVANVTESEETTDTIQATVPADAIDQGTCGKNLKWYLTEDGNLYINGTGKIEDYLSIYLSPWNDHIGKIKRVYLSDGITSIGDRAFSECYSLSAINIPNSVTSIGFSAFWGCKSLSTISIPNGVTSIGFSAFVGCSSLSEISIPNGVTSIEDSAFAGCSSLSTISIPNGVTSIGDYAFVGCSSLSEISIPNSVTSIGDGAFNGCSNLSTINIPNSVTSIGDYAFGCCSSLSTISIPSSVTNIGDGAFNLCDTISILNKDCKIYDNESTISSTAVIYGYSNSTAEEYAKKYNRTFKSLDGTGDNQEKNVTERSVTINYSGTPSGRFYLCTPDGTPISNTNFTYAISGEYNGEQGYFEYTRKTDGNGAYDFGWPHNITYSSGSNNKYTYEINILSVDGQAPDLLHSKFTLNAEVKNLEYTEKWTFGLSNTIQEDITKYSVLKKGSGGVGIIALKHNSDFTKDLTLSVQLSDSVFNSLSAKWKKANFKDQTASVGVKIGDVSNTNSSTDYKTFSKTIKGFDPLKKEHRELLSGYLFIIFNLSMENNVFVKQALDQLGYKDIFLQKFDVSESGIEVKVAGDASAVNLKLTSATENPLIDVSLFQPIKLSSMSSDSTYTYSVISEDGDYTYKAGLKAEKGLSGYSTLFDNMLGVSGRKGWSKLNDMSVSANADKISFKSCNFDSGKQEEVADLVYRYRNYVATGDAMAEISKNESVDRLRKGVLGPISESQLKDIVKSIENTKTSVSYTDTDRGISRISWGPSISIKNPSNQNDSLLSIGLKLSASRSCETESGNGYYLEGEAVNSSDSGTALTVASDIKHQTNCNDIFSYALLGMGESIGDTLSQATNSVVNGVKNGAAKIGEAVGSAVDWTVSITSSRKKDKIASEDEIQSYDVITSVEENVQSESEQILAKTVGDSYLVGVTDKDGNEITDLSAQPLSLTLSYTEEELKAAEVDDTTIQKLAIYRYDEENDIMNYVGGTVDSDKKTVTTMIDKTGEYILVVDGAAPQVTEFGASDTSSLPVLSAIIRDETGISNLTVTLDGETIVDSKNLEKYYNTKTGEFRYEVTKELSVGTHTISFYVKDSTGNTNENISYQFEVTQTPQIDSISVPDSIEMTKENQIAISASAKAFVNGEKENKISDVVAKIEIVNMDGTKKEDRISLGLEQDIWSGKIIVEKQTTQYNIQLIAYDELGGKVYSEVYPCKIICSHKWNESIKKEATCTETGSLETVCQVCGETKLEEIPALGHKEVKDEAIEATCTKEGKSEGSHCSECNAIMKKQEVIPAKGHSIKDAEKITKATLTKDGLISGKCSVCGEESMTEVIPYPKNIDLSMTSYIYTGKVKKPTVKVTDSSGQMIDSSNYDVIYPSGRINVGTYKLTVKFKGDKYTGSTIKTFTINPGNQTLTGTKEYKKVVGNARFYLDVKRTKGNGALSYKSSNTSVASVNSAGRVTINGAGTAKITVTAAATKSYKKKTFTVTITVNPRGTTLSSVTSGTSANMTVKWAKNSAVTGYEISYATKSDFSNERTYLVTSYKTTSKTIGKRTEGKKYYVRVRCYKTVSGVKYYSSWSAAKTVIILPKTVIISSVTSTAAGKLSVNWSQNANATGYQVQYATKSNFSGAKTTTVTSYETTSKSISGLTKGRKYYVRVRCYKTVGNTKYYSAWSSAKTVTVKKR